MLTATEENMAQFAHARWKLAYLIPSWGIQMAILLGSMGIFAYRLAETLENYKERDANGQVPAVEIVWEATYIGFSVVSLLLSIVEISKYAAEALTPFFLLSSQVVKITLAVAELALDIVVYQMQSDRNYSIVGLALDCAMLAATLLTFCYAIFIFRRLLKYEEYHAPSNPNRQSGGVRELELGKNHATSSRGYHDRSYSSASIGNDNPSTSYESQTKGFKRQVDQAVSAEFGWSTPAGAIAAPQPTGLTHGIVHSGKLSSSGTYDDDDVETVRMSHDGARHSSVPVLVVSGHEDDEDEDSRALLAPDGSHHDEAKPAEHPRYEDHPGAVELPSSSS